ncbi:CBL-interacting protein kinase 17-like [Oryza brachyantha]|uniref:CBL-interacting protein kinase 17-like n=1 Tax=Oryza brachyantha TaxID=4533 RepID=UPI001ADB9F23|nr:CBL-interacting protein kinase 17-like [Oryza brachyantha]
MSEVADTDGCPGKRDQRGKRSSAEFFPERRKEAFEQLIDGVSYCHDKGVYHGDLKPENVLVDKKGNIKISDFGLTAFTSHNDGLLHTTCVSPNYIAPEFLQNKGYNGSLSDIWSCGVILYIMLVGYLPFDDQNIVVVCQKGSGFSQSKVV